MLRIWGEPTSSVACQRAGYDSRIALVGDDVGSAGCRRRSSSRSALASPDDAGERLDVLEIDHAVG